MDLEGLGGIVIFVPFFFWLRSTMPARTVRAGIEFEIMFFVYVLKSRDYDFIYKGHCEDLEVRLKQHNSGMTKSIKAYLPLELIYKEEVETRDEAIKREKYFKSAAGRRYLKDKLAPYFNARPNGTGGDRI